MLATLKVITLVFGNYFTGERGSQQGKGSVRVSDGKVRLPQNIQKLVTKS